MTVQTLGLWASKPPESYTLPATSIHGGSHGLAHCQGAWILALTAHAHSQWHSIPDDPPAIHRNSPSLQISLGPWLADENVEPPCGDTKRTHLSAGLWEASSQSGMFSWLQANGITCQFPASLQSYVSRLVLLVFFGSHTCSTSTFSPCCFPGSFQQVLTSHSAFSFYLSPCIVLITLWLAFWLLMYLIFPVIKPLREQSLSQSYLFPPKHSK